MQCKRQGKAADAASNNDHIILVTHLLPPFRSSNVQSPVTTRATSNAPQCYDDRTTGKLQKPHGSPAGRAIGLGKEAVSRPIGVPVRGSGREPIRGIEFAAYQNTWYGAYAQAILLADWTPGRPRL